MANLFLSIAGNRMTTSDKKHIILEELRLENQKIKPQISQKISDRSMAKEESMFLWFQLI